MKCSEIRHHPMRRTRRAYLMVYLQPQPPTFSLAAFGTLLLLQQQLTHNKQIQYVSKNTKIITLILPIPKVQ
uniref:Uncharacterized protein MANES_14G003300 n=1 Tax=Rhizophora mucronata TaxID=61149 RepID=A0A2P2N3S4_RHIMU